MERRAPGGVKDVPSGSRGSWPAPSRRGLLPVQMDDFDLQLRSAQRGDSGAFRMLYEHFRPSVQRLLQGFGWLDAIDREDVMQEAFVRAFRGLSTLRVDAAFEGWLHGIVRNRALTLGGRKHRQARALEALAATASESVPLIPEALRAELDGSVVRELIDALPAGAEKETVVLYYLEGELSTRRIAERLGVGKSAIGMRLDRFRARMRGELAARLDRARRW